MKKLLLVVVSTVGLGACGFPETKMEPVGSKQMETQQAPAPDATSAPASEKSANAKR
jgi:hypothetical protein